MAEPVAEHAGSVIPESAPAKGSIDIVVVGVFSLI